MPKNRPAFSKEFKKAYDRCDPQTRSILEKCMLKILDRPELGKPLRHAMARYRAERMGSFRIVYSHSGDEVFFYSFEHRKKVYR